MKTKITKKSNNSNSKPINNSNPKYNKSSNNKPASIQVSNNKNKAVVVKNSNNINKNIAIATPVINTSGPQTFVSNNVSINTGTGKIRNNIPSVGINTKPRQLDSINVSRTTGNNKIRGGPTGVFSSFISPKNNKFRFKYRKNKPDGRNNSQEPGLLAKIFNRLTGTSPTNVANSSSSIVSPRRPTIITKTSTPKTQIKSNAVKSPGTPKTNNSKRKLNESISY